MKYFPMSHCASGSSASPFPYATCLPPTPGHGQVLGIVYRAISTHLIHKAGLSLRDGATGAVTLIQRFGSALRTIALSYFVPGWRLSVSRQQAAPISARQSTE